VGWESREGGKKKGEEAEERREEKQKERGERRGEGEDRRGEQREADKSTGRWMLLIQLLVYDTMLDGQIR